MGVERDSVYYLPQDIADGAKQWIRAEALFEGVPEAKFRYPEICPVEKGKRVPLKYRKDLVLEPFEVKHSVPAMGATLYLHKRKLKQEYLGKTPAEIIELRKNNVEITREVFEPLVSFLGDCLGESLLQNASVFQSKVLVLECTFLDDEDEPMSHKKGHTHLQQVVNALEKNRGNIACEKIILTHFSMKYSEKHIRDMLDKNIPDDFKGIVVPFI